MKTLILVTATVATMGLASCEKCYTCETVLGTETECCGDKEECEVFRDDCKLSGGTLD